MRRFDFGMLGERKCGPILVFQRLVFDTYRDGLEPTDRPTDRMAVRNVLLIQLCSSLFILYACYFRWEHVLTK